MERSTAKIEVNRPQDGTATPVDKPQRPRSSTMIKLQWLAEQVRKSLRIKDQINSGAYRVDSRAIAKAILNRDEE